MPETLEKRGTAEIIAELSKVKHHTVAGSQEEGAAAASDPARIGPIHTDGTPLSEEEILLAQAVADHNAQTWSRYAQLPWDHPVGRVFWIHISHVQANDYNPNSVAQQEMQLLHTSISEDGYTQPIVSIWDGTAGADRGGRFVIVDGFHRYTTMRMYEDIYVQSDGYTPVVVLEKSIADRIAATVRHNRARGKHSVEGMGHLVFQMLEAGESDETVCNKLGLEAEELARLKHVTGYSKLYKNHSYSTTVLTKTQLEERAAYAKTHPGEELPEGV